MTAIDFPDSPTLNQQFTASGRVWQWNGTSWDSVSTTPESLHPFLTMGA